MAHMHEWAKLQQGWYVQPPATRVRGRQRPRLRSVPRDRPCGARCARSQCRHRARRSERQHFLNCSFRAIRKDDPARANFPRDVRGGDNPGCPLIPQMPRQICPRHDDAVSFPSSIRAPHSTLRPSASCHLTSKYSLPSIRRAQRPAPLSSTSSRPARARAPAPPRRRALASAASRKASSPWSSSPLSAVAGSVVANHENASSPACAAPGAPAAPARGPARGTAAATSAGSVMSS